MTRSKAKKKAKARRTRDARKLRSAQQQELAALRKSVLDRLPIAEEELPDELVHALELAITEASAGRPGMLEQLVSAMDSMVGPSQGRRALVRDDAAAELLATIDTDRDSLEIENVARQAIELDPHAVDALILLGDLARTKSQRLDHYRHACREVTHLDGDLVREVMPLARLHMARQLMTGGLIVEATEILEPAMIEDPEDPCGAAVELVSLYLRLEWYDELQGLLERVDGDDLGVIAYARALSAFQRGGGTRRSQALLQVALAVHGEAALYLSGIRSMPREGDRLTPEEHDAVCAAEYLLPGLRSMSGAVAWIRESLEGVAPLDHEEDGGDPLEVALELPLGDATWRLLVERCDGGWALLMLEENEPVLLEWSEERPKTDKLRSFVLQSIATPVYGEPRKPVSIAVTTKASKSALSKSCATYGVTVLHQAIDKLERDQITAFLASAVKGGIRLDDTIDISNEAFSRVPEADETWAFGIFHPPIWIDSGATPQRHYMLLVLNADQGTILGHQLLSEMPSTKELGDALRATMMQPAIGEPRRASKLLIDPKAHTILGQAFVTAVEEEVPGVRLLAGEGGLKSAFDDLVADMLVHGQPLKASLWESACGDEDLLASLYSALANFYRAKPWKMVAGDQFIRVTNEAWEIPDRAACVMGQLGQSLGLALLDGVETVEEMLVGNERAMAGRSVSLEFGEAFEAMPVDLWYQERMGFELAGPEAYPCLFRVGKKMTPEPLSEEDVRVLIQLLPHIPRFLDHPRGKDFEVSGGGQRLRLSWVN